MWRRDGIAFAICFVSACVADIVKGPAVGFLVGGTIAGLYWLIWG